MNYDKELRDLDVAYSKILEAESILRKMHSQSTGLLPIALRKAYTHIQDGKNGIGEVISCISSTENSDNDNKNVKYSYVIDVDEGWRYGLPAQLITEKPLEEYSNDERKSLIRRWLTGLGYPEDKRFGYYRIIKEDKITEKGR